MPLILKSSASDFAQPMDEDRPCEAAAGLALVDIRASDRAHHGDD
jgi:hypothetical protein